MDNTQLQIEVVSPSQIFHDYLYLLKATSIKINKRVHRFRFICELMGIDADTILSTISILPEKIIDITEEDIEKCLKCSMDPIFDKIKLNSRSPIHLAKEFIEAKLTNALNCDDTIYNITCNYTLKLIKHIRKHDVFGPLMNNRDIIFIHKGSMAQKRVFSRKYPQKSEDIQKCFGYGGDNDCIILINPNLDNFVYLHSLITDFVKTFLLNNVDYISNSIINNYAKCVNKINIQNIELEVRPSVRNHFEITSENNTSVLQNQISKNEVYTSCNRTISFLDDAGSTSKFNLLRYKKAFLVRYKNFEKVFGGEILDISIPNFEEYDSKIEFEQYRPENNWTTYIYI